jgi:Peptidase family M48
MLLRYSRDFEKQADLLGAQIMARAGYDPRALAHMFETIERDAKSSGGGGPQWLNSHPNPGNRTEYINKEATLVAIASPADTSEFEPMKTAFAGLPAAKSTADLAKAKSTSGGGESVQAVGTPGQPVPPPSSQYRDIRGGNVFRASVPSNWTALSSSNAVKVVPQNGYGPYKGETVFSHGVEFGVAKAASRDLQDATDAWLKAVTQNNPGLRVAGSQKTTRISDRSALTTPLVNPSPLGGQERIDVYTTFLADGSLFYYMTVTQENDAEALRGAFQHVVESIRLTEAR